MFELGKWDLYVETFMGSKIFYIENFYKNPEKVKQFTTNPLPKLWRVDTAPNGCFYHDRRLEASVEDSSINKNYEILSQVIGQRRSFSADGGNNFISNVTKYLKHSYNDYENCNWWPHTDSGYNAIITLNDEFGEEEYPGTSLYHPDDVKDFTGITHEGQTPWIDKNTHRLVKVIQAKYNRCVLFDGLKFPHAMHIDGSKFFDNTYRVNQVLFFEPYD